MNINQLRIDGFGAWTGLRLEGFEPGLNVIYGPNEAGKSTLLEFLRSMLYGFAEPRCNRYLPPVNGGQPGGAIQLRTARGVWELARHDDPLAAERVVGRLRLADDHGAELDSARLDELLAGVDEKTFNHVFAIGLTEIQELGTLDDSAAAQLLYNLTTGLDRVLLGDVMRDLAAARRNLLSAPGHDSLIPRLLAQRHRLREEIAGLAEQTPRYARAVQEREQLAGEIAALERESADLSRQVRMLEAAVGLRDKWSRRALLDQQLALVSAGGHIPPGSLQRLDALAQRLARRKHLLLKLRGQRKKLRQLGREFPASGTLLRQAARVQALCDQQDIIIGLERKADELSREVAALDGQMRQQTQRMEKDRDVSPAVLKGLSRSALAELKPLARAMEEAASRLEQARHDDAHDRERHAAATAQQQQQHQLHQQRQQAAAVPEPRAELITAVQDAGERVAMLRRRAQLDQRLEQMQAHSQELDDQAGDLLEQQLLPLWVVVALGGVFVLGVVLILAGWWLSFGWAVAVLGVAGIIASVVLKHHLENAAEQQAESNEKQLALLKRQIGQAKEEREQLDEELPQGGGPILVRLEKAEAELARLEARLPSPTPVQMEQPLPVVTPTVVLNPRRLADAEAACRTSQSQWKDALVALGFSANLTPHQVWQLSHRSRSLRELDRRLCRLREEEATARQNVRSFGDRVAQMLADVGLMPASQKTSEQLRQLRQELTEQESLAQKRRELVRKHRRLKRRENKLASSRRRLLAYRRRLFEQAGAIDEQEFRRRATDYARLAELRSSREAIQREIALALGTQHTEESLRNRLETLAPEKMEAEWEELSGRLARCQASIKQRLERRGQLSHEIEQLAADRRLPERQLELGLVQQRLQEATRDWQAHAVTSSLLEKVRSRYERDRQPETLQDASELFRELSAGRYVRVWTPMDQDRLLVDEPDGRSLPVEVLSRGTREQLFLGLRLALVRNFARRGVRLPMVLDDVLVNFDAGRAKAAATVLAQFADEGHQLLVFTCHEHIARLMRSLRAPVTELPNRHELRVDQPEPQPKRPRTRRKVRPVEAVQVAVEEAPPPLVVEEPVVAAEPVGFLAPPIEVVRAAPVAPPPPVEVLEAEPVIEPPILIARPLPEPSRARPLIDEKPPLPSNPAEAHFVEYDPLLPLNREPATAPRIREELRPTPPIKMPPAPPIQPSRPRAWWGFFHGNGAEEFAGEFATRGGYYEE